jgi:hypothetical protein
MTLTPRKKRQALAKPIDNVDGVAVRISPIGNWFMMMAVSLESMAELHNQKPGDTGIPRYVALESGQSLIFFPIPDKKYECQVSGYIRVVQ